jgi:signal transduction histidine kinase
MIDPASSAVAPWRGADSEQIRRWYSDEAAARLRSELAELRLLRLVELSAALSRSATRAEVAAVVLTQALGALHADTGFVAIRRRDELDVELLPGFPGAGPRLQPIPLTARLPLVDCMLERRTAVYASPEAMALRYPDLPSVTGIQTWVFLPMITDDRAVGAIGLGYVAPTTLCEDDRQYMDLLAQQCALALDRAALYEIEREARNAREEALAIAAHDLRTPLASVALSAALLEQSPDEKVRSRAGTIRRAADRATELLRDLLDAAVIEQGALPVQVAPCDGAALVRELHELFAPLADAKGIELRTACSGDVGAIAVDRARMHQALSNLLGNALKLTPPEGQVELCLLAQAGRLRFVVRDTGPGIAPESVPRLFDRYWQARATSRAGVGLGLYIVKGIVDAHGGSVHVETTPGAGATFTLTIGA